MLTHLASCLLRARAKTTSSRLTHAAPRLDFSMPWRTTLPQGTAVCGSACLPQSITGFDHDEIPHRARQSPSAVLTTLHATLVNVYRLMWERCDFLDSDQASVDVRPTHEPFTDGMTRNLSSHAPTLSIKNISSANLQIRGTSVAHVLVR